MNYFNCSYCGKFISYNDLDEKKVGVEYTFDSDYSCEETLYYHKVCKERDENRIQNPC